MLQVSKSRENMAASRETIHDLRNLFGVVASARHLLDRSCRPVDREQLLEAIEQAAMRGGALTTELLARRCPTALPGDITA